MSAQSSPQRPAESHLHLATSRCPTCDQPVANDKLNEITARLTARDQQISTSVRDHLNKDFATRIAMVDADAKAELQRVANDNATAIEKLKLDAAEREAAVRLEAETALKEQVSEAERQRQAAEDASVAARVALQTLRETSETALAYAHEEAAIREAAARDGAASAAEARLKDKMAEAAQVRDAAELVASSKTRELEELRGTSTAAIEGLKIEMVSREATARAAAKAETEAAWRLQLDEIIKAKEAAETQATTLAASQQERLDEQRAALDSAKDEAVNAEKAKAFDEKLKFETQLKDLARQLEKKTADELGEGAEVKLLDDLKEQFEGDIFTHIGKGNPGADIIQEVVHNGKVCGKIVFEFQRPECLAQRICVQVAQGSGGREGRSRDPVGPSHACRHQADAYPGWCHHRQSGARADAGRVLAPANHYVSQTPPEQ